jgi:integrase
LIFLDRSIGNAADFSSLGWRHDGPRLFCPAKPFTSFDQSVPVSDKTKTSDLLFPRLALEWVSVAFARLCRKKGILDFHFHDLRHTAASWLRMKGADIHTVAQLLGHKDLRMAARYQHLSAGFLADAVGGLDTAFAECHQYVTVQKTPAEEAAASA